VTPPPKFSRCFCFQRICHSQGNFRARARTNMTSSFIPNPLINFPSGWSSFSCESHNNWIRETLASIWIQGAFDPKPTPQLEGYYLFLSHAPSLHIDWPRKAVIMCVLTVRGSIETSASWTTLHIDYAPYMMSWIELRNGRFDK
jgi:hypothetical protein